MTEENKVYRVLRARRMCRAYLPEEVPRDKLLRVLEAARRVPSAGHAQGLRLAVLQDAQTRNEIAQLLGEEAYAERGFPRWFSSAPVHLLVGSEVDDYRERYAEPDKSSDLGSWPISYPVLDGGKALMALYLAAHSEDLACGYLGPHRCQVVFQHFPEVASWLPLGLVTLGYPDWAAQRRSTSHGRGWRDFNQVVLWLDNR